MSLSRIRISKTYLKRLIGYVIVRILNKELSYF